VPVGLLSGYLVSTYLPEDGSKPDGQTLWLIVGVLTMYVSVDLLVLWVVQL
jgi:hypothetical protein